MFTSEVSPQSIADEVRSVDSMSPFMVGMLGMAHHCTNSDMIDIPDELL